MRRLITLFLATALASPALAQHAGHDPHAGHAAAEPAPAPEAAPPCTPEHAAMGHCTMPAPEAAPPCTPEHAAMGHCTMPAPPPTTDSHASHEEGPNQQADPHAGHGMQASPAPPVAPPPPEALAGPRHAQDLFYDRSEAARSRSGMAREHGAMKSSKFLFDRLEAAVGNGRDAYAWDAQFWYGGDIDKLWLKSEGDGEFRSRIERAEVQALWSRAIDPWFDLQAGVRQDLRHGPDRTHLVLGIQGLAPYWFEVEGVAFLSGKGEVTARFEAEYDLRLTQALILQPSAELDLSLQDIPELGLGSGITTAELGVRLRYEFFPRSGPAVIAPYVGVQYERAFGGTAGFRRAGGDDAGGWSALLGVRTWF